MLSGVVLFGDLFIYSLTMINYCITKPDGRHGRHGLHKCHNFHILSITFYQLSVGMFEFAPIELHHYAQLGLFTIYATHAMSYYMKTTTEEPTFTNDKSSLTCSHQ